MTDYDLVPITDPEEVASVLRNGVHDIIGEECQDGTVVAYRWSLERWRAKRATASVRPVYPEGRE